MRKPKLCKVIQAREQWVTLVWPAKVWWREPLAAGGILNTSKKTNLKKVIAGVDYHSQEDNENYDHPPSGYDSLIMSVVVGVALLYVKTTSYCCDCRG